MLVASERVADAHARPGEQRPVRVDRGEAGAEDHAALGLLVAVAEGGGAVDRAVAPVFPEVSIARPGRREADAGARLEVAVPRAQQVRRHHREEAYPHAVTGVLIRL